MGWFDEDENNSSMVAARLASDATNVRAAIGDRISVIAQNAALLVFTFALCFTASWRLTLVMGSVFPLLCLSNLAEVRLVFSLLSGLRGN
jgi:ATP-binding cassette subfamily B (MDR/TAP) protein 1